MYQSKVKRFMMTYTYVHTYAYPVYFCDLRKKKKKNIVCRIRTCFSVAFPSAYYYFTLNLTLNFSNIASIYTHVCIFACVTINNARLTSFAFRLFLPSKFTMYALSIISYTEEPNLGFSWTECESVAWTFLALRSCSYFTHLWWTVQLKNKNIFLRYNKLTESCTISNTIGWRFSKFLLSLLSTNSLVHVLSVFTSIAQTRQRFESSNDWIL